MPRWTLGTLILGAVSLLAYAIVGGEVPATPVAGPPPGLEEMPREQVRTAKDLLDDYFGGPDLGAGESIDVLFVHFPDPIDSKLDWAFDSMFFAVRKAFECTGYVSDRRWTPWTEDRRAAESPGGMDPKLRHRHPGVMLFRRSHGPDTMAGVRRLPVPGADGGGLRGAGGLGGLGEGAERAELVVVFMIGEDPVVGVHRPAFDEALRQRRAVLASAAPLRIVGPVFSGSAPSLRRALVAAPELEDVHFLSGSATGQPDRLREQLGGGLDRPKVSFGSMVHSDCERRRALEDVIGRFGLDLSQVALFQEWTTSYGRDAAASPSRDSQNPCLGDAEAGGVPLVLPFPMSIGSLRNLTESTRGGTWKPPAWRPAAVPLDLGSSPATGAPSSLDAQSALTPAAVDLLLEEIAQVLLHERIRAAVIVATDVRDTIFLSSELRSRMRGIRLFTLSNNVLYARPDHGEALRGLVTVSTFPLLPASRARASSGVRQHLAFPNEQAEGVYNATALALGNTGALSYRVAFPERLAETVFPFPISRLPLWVTSVGARTQLPIMTLKSSNDGVPAEAIAAPSISRVALWGVFLVACAILHLSVLAPVGEGASGRGFIRRLWHLAKGLAAWRKTSGDRGAASEGWKTRLLHRLLATGSCSSLPEHRRTRFFQIFIRCFEQLYAGFFMAALVSLLLPHLAFWWLSASLGQVSVELSSFRGPQSNVVAPLALVLVMVFCVLATIVGVARIIACVGRGALGLKVLLEGHVDLTEDLADDGRGVRRRQWWHWEIVRQAALGAILLFLYFGAVLVYSLTIITGQVAGPDLVLFRAVQIEDGVTPLLPLSIIGAILVLWTAWHRKRLERLTKDPPFGIAMHEHWSVDELRKPRAARRRPTDSYRFLGFVAQEAIRVRETLFYVFAPGGDWKHLVWLLPTGLWLWLSFGTSYESLVLPEWIYLAAGVSVPSKLWSVSTFDIVVRTGVLLALVTLTSTVFRFWTVARRLRDLLQKLASTPLLTAFERLPKRISRLARLPLFAQPGSWVVQATSEQNRQYLQRIAGELERVQVAESTPDDALTPLRDKILKLHRLWRQVAPTDAAALWPPGRTAPLRTEILKLQKTGGIPQRRTEPVEESRRKDLDFDERCRLADFLKQVEDVLQVAWRREPCGSEPRKIADILAQPGREPSDLSSVASQVQRRFVEGPAGLWQRTAEELVAVEAIGYVESVLKQLQRMLVFLLPAILLTGMLLGCYPFEPQGLMSSFFIAVVLASVAVLVYVMISLNRDEILSRLSRTDPHRFTWHATFVFNLVLILGVGGLALVSTEYPTVWHIFLGWFRPLLEAIVR